MAISNTPSEAKGGYVLITTVHGYKYIACEVLRKNKKKKNEPKV